MSEFNENINNEEIKNDIDELQVSVQEEEQIPPEEPFFEDEAPVWNKVNYTQDLPITDYKPMNKGLKVFCLILAAVILLTGSCTAGYFLGRSSVSGNYIGSIIDVDLESRPKNEDALTPAQVYAEVNKSIVGIRVYNASGQMGDASGVIYTDDGYIVTNDHIYSEIGAPNFKIYTHDGTEYDAVYVAGDVVSDLAVLKIEEGSGFKAASFGNSNELYYGEDVVAIGRPSDATDASSITGGMVSMTKKRVKTTSNYTARLIQTDSAINPGSSGGALVNMYGQVIGITSSKLAGEEYDDVGFAIPTTTMKRVVEQLISQGKVTDRAKLGITYTEVNSVTAQMGGYDSAGLYVVSVGEDSDIFGKVGEGDMITHVNGQAITNDDIILDVIEDCKAGDTITLTVISKNGKQTDYNVKLKANIGESSYSETITQSNTESQQNSSEGSGGGTFDFPFGE